MNTISPHHTGDGRRRRLHSDEFKANAVALAAQPGMSMAAVPMSLGINANLLRRWVRDAEIQPRRPEPVDAPKALPGVTPGPAVSGFVPVHLPTPAEHGILTHAVVKTGSPRAYSSQSTQLR